MKRRGFLGLAAVPAVAPLLASCSGGSGGNEVEVFTWWTGPGEEEGLEELIKIFESQNEGLSFVNAAIAGGGGEKAKGILANRLQNQDPPDSFQGHAGAEMFDYIDNGVLEDVTDFLKSEKLTDALHPSLLEGVTVDGKSYSVPVNVHRANLLWYNPSVLADADVEPPKSWKELIEQHADLGKGDQITLAVGGAMTQQQLLETVLLGELGFETYNGLWDGKTDWSASEVTDALDLFIEVLGVSDIKNASDDWQPQLDKMIDGTAAYAVVGDWAYSYMASSQGLTWEEDYNVVETPGSEGVFDYLADSFTKPVNAQNPEHADAWLKVCGSAEGQTIFNTTKGSLPARTDIDESEFSDYLAWNYQQWTDESTEVVGSLAHGAVARPGWKTEIDTALEAFIGNEDSAAFAEAVTEAYEKTNE